MLSKKSPSKRPKSEIVDMYERRIAGQTLDQISRDYGITKQRVHQLIVREYGANPVFRKSKDGNPYCKFCRGHYPKGGYAQHCRDAGHKTHVPIATHPQRENIVADYLRGDRVYDISKRYGVQLPMIYRHLRQLGYEPNRGGSLYVRDEEMKRRRRANKVAKKLGQPLPYPTHGWGWKRDE